VDLPRTLVTSNMFSNQIHLVREYCRAHSTRRTHDAAAVIRKSQDAGAGRKKGGKKEKSDKLARDGDVDEEDLKEVILFFVTCLLAN
jgi:hypothetical protein